MYVCLLLKICSWILSSGKWTALIERLYISTLMDKALYDEPLIHSFTLTHHARHWPVHRMQLGVQCLTRGHVDRKSLWPAPHLEPQMSNTDRVDVCSGGWNTETERSWNSSSNGSESWGASWSVSTERTWTILSMNSGGYCIKELLFKSENPRT